MVVNAVSRCGLSTYTITRNVLGPLPLPRRTDLNHRMHSLAVQLRLPVQVHHVQPEDVRCLATFDAEVEPRPISVLVRCARTIGPCPNVDLGIVCGQMLVRVAGQRVQGGVEDVWGLINRGNQ